MISIENNKNNNQKQQDISEGVYYQDSLTDNNSS